MRLLLMRHADAVNAAADDFSRALSERGKADAASMGGWLKAVGLVPDRVVASPYCRALQTARAVMDAQGNPAPVTTDSRLEAGMDAGEGAALIHEYGREDGCLLLLGHAPDMGRLVAHCIGSESDGVRMRKGAAALLEVGRPGFGGSILEWLIHPGLRG